MLCLNWIKFLLAPVNETHYPELCFSPFSNFLYIPLNPLQNDIIYLLSIITAISSAPRIPFTQQSLAVPSTCNERLGQLVGDIFIGHEMIPQVLELPPDYPLELTYRQGQLFSFND